MFQDPVAQQLVESVSIRRRSQYDRDAVIVSGADAERTICVVLKGTVRLSLLDADGREMALAYLGEGSLFGEQAALGKAPLSANLVALADEPCEIGHIAIGDFIAALNRRGHIHELMRMTSEKTSLFLQATSRSIFGSARSRLGSILRAIGRDQEWIEVSHERLARLCGCTRATIATQLHALEKDNVVRMRRNRLQVVDPNALEPL